MTTYLTFMAGVLVGWIVRVSFEGIKHQHHDPDVPCPHGHVDWDQCPDCCH
jgi:hypothetical protein